MDIKKEKKAIKNLKAFYMEDWNLTEEERDDLDNLVSRIVDVVKTEAQAVPDTYTPIVLALEDVQSKIAKTSFLTMDEENENEVMAVNANELAAYIDELIELQEPTND